MIEPIRRTVTVQCDPQTAFRVFTAELGTWWPLETFSRAADREDPSIKTERVVFEEHVGGRIYEVLSDSSEADWGTVEAWEPPSRVVYAWRPHDRPVPPTEVELRFSPDGTGTRVELEHRGWERLEELAEAGREGYANGWPLVLDERFVQAANAAALA
jgi:uncharacterized protein YndB with AHSA1/START domain